MQDMINEGREDNPK